MVLEPGAHMTPEELAEQISHHEVTLTIIGNDGQPLFPPESIRMDKHSFRLSQTRLVVPRYGENDRIEELIPGETYMVLHGKCIP